MFLRRIIDHVSTQNWTAIWLDLIIVVVGVFLGLQVQEWAEERDRRQLETTYTERLHDEVVDLQETRRYLVDIRAQWAARMRTVTPLLFGVVDRLISQEECQSIALSYIVSNPTDDLASLIELQSSGRLSIFRNEQVSEVLRSYLLTRARARDSQRGISSGMKILSSDYPQLIRVASPTVTTERPPVSGMYNCDVDGMRASPGFLNDFEIIQSNQAFHVGDNARVSASLDGLHRVLDEVLGISHEEPPQ